MHYAKSSNFLFSALLALSSSQGICAISPVPVYAADVKTGSSSFSKNISANKKELSRFALQYQAGLEAQISELQRQLKSSKKECKSLRAALALLREQVSAMQGANGSADIQGFPSPKDNEPHISASGNGLASGPGSSFRQGMNPPGAGSNDPLYEDPARQLRAPEIVGGSAAKTTEVPADDSVGWGSSSSNEKSGSTYKKELASNTFAPSLPLPASDPDAAAKAYYLEKIRRQLSQAMAYAAFDRLSDFSGSVCFDINRDGTPSISADAKVEKGRESNLRKLEELVRRAGPFRPFVEQGSSNRILVNCASGRDKTPSLTVSMLRI